MLGGDGFCASCEPPKLEFGGSPAKALPLAMIEISASPNNMRCMIDCPKASLQFRYLPEIWVKIMRETGAQDPETTAHF